MKIDSSEFPNILIIDNDKKSISIISTILNDNNCNIITADSEQQAIEKINHFELLLIILDIKIVIKDNVITDKLFKKAEKIPIILLSDEDKKDEWILECYKKGVVDFLVKTVAPLILKNKISVFINLHNQKKEFVELLEFQEIIADNLIDATNKHRETNETLKNEIKHRKKIEKELQKAKEAADDANESKSIFLANMSHEIRTPLNAIIGFTNILLKNEKTAEKRKYLDIIVSSGRHLLELINDILDLSKIEAGKIVIFNSNFSMYNLFGYLNDFFTPMINEKGLDFDCALDKSFPKYVSGDFRHIKQIFLNMLSNSIKFTHEGTITVSGTYNENKATITIKDTGEGIDKKNQKKVFDAFEQVRSKKENKFKGTGLGLAITNKMISAMNGSISMESTLGHGTTFTIILPLPKGVKPLDDKQINIAKNGKNIINEHVLEKWLSNYIGNPAILAIVLISIKSLPEYIDKLEKSANEEKIESVKSISHEIYGSYGSLKMVEISNIARKIEKESTKENYSLKKIVNQITRLKDIISYIPDKYFEEQILEDNIKKLETGFRILVAEDNEINQQLIQAYMSAIGINCDFAENGLIALDLLQKNKYILLLLDMQMPVMDGVETIKKIRSNKKLKDLKVIALTAFAMKGDKDKYISIGCNDYLAKPIDEKELKDKILDTLKEYLD